MGRMALIYVGVRAVERAQTPFGALVRMMFVARQSGAYRLGPVAKVTIDSGTYAAWVR